MSRRRIAVLYLCCAFVFAAALVHESGTRNRSMTGSLAFRMADANHRPIPAIVAIAALHIPLSFEVAPRQTGRSMEFVAPGLGYAVAMGSSGVVFERRKGVPSSDFRLTWLGANPSSTGEGLERENGATNYLQGSDPRKWRTNAPRFGKVRFGSLYRGIDLVYHGNRGRVEMDYVVAPKASPQAIRVAIGAPGSVAIDAQGDLSLKSRRDELRLLAPVAYQEIHGRRQIVDAAYILESSRVVRFKIGHYDTSQPLIIDPVLEYAASFGGGDDMISDVATDAQGNVYLAGTTCSTSYPVTSAALRTSGGGSAPGGACNDIIVTKLDPTASSLIYSTYIGGSRADYAARILVDAAGNVVLAGSTASADFPTTSGAYQTAAASGTCPGGSADQPCTHGFLLKLDPSGSRLLFSTLLGGERTDAIHGLAQDAATGNLYVAGATDSAEFPIADRASSAQPIYGGDDGNCKTTSGATAPCFDAFVAEFNSSGTQLIASTYLGGNRDDAALDLALGADHDVYVTGGAGSPNFPATPGAFQTTRSSTAGRDVFVAKLNSSLSQILYSTFIGGSADQFATRIRVDSTGATYVGGSTTSVDFPVSPASEGPFQKSYSGPEGTTCPAFGDATSPLFCGDAFVAKLSPEGNSLAFSTYLGGASDDGALNLALDSGKNIWVTGTTRSSDFPLTASALLSSPASGDAFLSEISAGGTQNLFSTRLPAQQGLAISVDDSDNVFVAGESRGSGQSALVTPGTYSNGQAGAFLMKFSGAGTSASATRSADSTPAAAPTFTVSVQPGSLTVNAGQPGTLTVTITPVGGFMGPVVTGCAGLPPGGSCSAGSVTITGTGSQSAAISVMTTAAAALPIARRWPGISTFPHAIFAAVVALFALVLMVARSPRLGLRAILSCGAFLFAMVLLSCGSSGSSSGGGGGTPAGTYAITISGAAGSIVVDAPNTVTLTVK